MKIFIAMGYQASSWERRKIVEILLEINTAHAYIGDTKTSR